MLDASLGERMAPMALAATAPVVAIPVTVGLQAERASASAAVESNWRSSWPPLDNGSRAGGNSLCASC